jgi:hypothetical protein
VPPGHDGRLRAAEAIAENMTMSAPAAIDAAARPAAGRTSPYRGGSAEVIDQQHSGRAGNAHQFVKRRRFREPTTLKLLGWTHHCRRL